MQVEIDFIKKNAYTIPLKRIARILGRSQTYVRAVMDRQGIVVPQHIRDQWKRENQFKPGDEPANKGLKQDQYMTAEAIENTKKTRYQKGNIPHNTRCDYEVSLRTSGNKYKYYYIRLSKSKWVLLHRWLWQQMYGDIPSGHNVQFKDGNSLIGVVFYHNLKHKNYGC